MSVTALFATSGATNGGLYPASGLCEQLASVGQFPPVMGRRLADRAPTGLLLTAAIAVVLAVGFDLNAIASIGSAIALVVFALVTAGHLRVRDQTGARLPILIVGITSTVIVLVTFTLTTLVHEPSTLIAIVVVLAVSVGLDGAWKRSGRAGVAVT
jgi:amino acid transporter